MLVSLDRSSRLSAKPDDKIAAFDIHLIELEGDPFLIRHEWEIALTAMERQRRSANSRFGESLVLEFQGCFQSHDALPAQAGSTLVSQPRKGLG
jgi:hypothetical protein